MSSDRSLPLAGAPGDALAAAGDAGAVPDVAPTGAGHADASAVPDAAPTGAGDASGALPAELLERLRAIGLRLDRAGRFWHAGAEVTHPRLRQALLGWLDVRDDGRDVIRLDDRRYAYVDVDDAHLRARSARWDGDRCWVRWDDDREAELAYATLRQGPDHALYATARGRLRGRIAGPAYHAIAERIVEDAPAGAAAGLTDATHAAHAATAGAPGFALVAAGRRWPIADAR